MARGGSSRRDRGGRAPQSQDVQLSKKLSWLLRHGAEKEGLKLGPGGFIALDKVMKNRTIAGMKPSLAQIKQLVAENDKQRYSLMHISSSPEDDDAAAAALANPDDEAANYLIRANQGHSLKVEDEGLVTPLTLDSPSLPSIIVHGTRNQAWPLIVASGGLKPMGRNHVHFATGLPREIQLVRDKSASQALASSSAGEAEIEAKAAEDDAAPEVISGMRVSSSILMFLDLEKALRQGIKFGQSANGVILSEGGPGGIVPLDVFKTVEDRRGRILLKDGQLVERESK